MQTESDIQAKATESSADTNPTQANMTNNNYQSGTGAPDHIDSTRPNCPFQNNPYYREAPNPGLNSKSRLNPANQNPYIQKTQTANVKNNSGFNTGDFVKGALIGAAVTYLMTNKNVQDALFKTVAKTSNLFQVGMEEVKERFEDAKAEVQAENQTD